MAPTQAETTALIDLLDSTLALFTQFTTSLSSPAPPSSTTTTSTTNSPNPLLLLRDAATLLKAHTTKLSLLAINKPFTPSAIRKVLAETTGSCVPALVSGVQICSAADSGYGRVMGRESGARVRRVVAELGVLVREVRGVAEGKTGGAGAAAAAAGRRDSLASTGVVWASCDAVAELAGLGIGGLAAQKAEQDRETIKDGIAEVREWLEGEDLETEGGDELLDEEDEAVEGDRDGLEDLFHAANRMPQDRPELRALVERAEGKLKKVVLLYTAVIKRRLKTFKGVGGRVEELDACVESLRRIPHQVDELASLFYDLDEEQAAQMLAKCVAEAKCAGKAVLLGWQGQEDEYTAWYKKWEDAIGD